jgi:hypothetical protein
VKWLKWSVKEEEEEDEGNSSCDELITYGRTQLVRSTVGQLN